MGPYLCRRATMDVSTATSAVARNDLLAAVLYPDAADSADSVQLQYNLQSEGRQMQNQNGNVHQYGRDLLSPNSCPIRCRFCSPSTDNNKVVRINTEYEIRGMVTRSTSYGDVAGTTIVNQVSLAFGEFEQQTGETQDNSATGGPVSVVGYGYNTGGTSNSIEPIR